MDLTPLHVLLLFYATPEYPAVALKFAKCNRLYKYFLYLLAIMLLLKHKIRTPKRNVNDKKSY